MTNSNPLYPFEVREDSLTQEFEQAVFMDDTDEMLEEGENE